MRNFSFFYKSINCKGLTFKNSDYNKTFFNKFTPRSMKVLYLRISQVEMLEGVFKHFYTTRLKPGCVAVTYVNRRNLKVVGFDQ